ADLAKQYLDAALDLNPAMPEAHFMLGKAALLGTNDNEAEEQFQLAIAPDPQSSTAEFAYYQLAQVYRREHHRKEMIAALKQFETLHDEARRRERDSLRHREQIYGQEVTR